MKKKFIVMILVLLTILTGCQEKDVTKAETTPENTKSVDKEKETEETKPIQLGRNGGINQLLNQIDQYTITQDHYLKEISFELTKYDMAVWSAGQRDPKILTSIGDTDVVLLAVRKETGFSTGKAELVIDVGLAHTFKEEGGTLVTDYVITDNISPRSKAEIRVRDQNGDRPQYLGRSMGGEHDEIPEERFSWHLNYEEVRQSESWAFEIVGLKKLEYEGN